jgi:hypothetical protein
VEPRKLASQTQNQLLVKWSAKITLISNLFKISTRPPEINRINWGLNDGVCDGGGDISLYRERIGATADVTQSAER